jgi:hypothetical protein
MKFLNSHSGVLFIRFYIKCKKICFKFCPCKPSPPIHIEVLAGKAKGDRAICVRRGFFPTLSQMTVVFTLQTLYTINMEHKFYYTMIHSIPASGRNPFFCLKLVSQLRSGCVLNVKLMQKKFCVFSRFIIKFEHGNRI